MGLQEKPVAICLDDTDYDDRRDNAGQPLYSYGWRQLAFTTWIDQRLLDENPKPEIVAKALPYARDTDRRYNYLVWLSGRGALPDELLGEWQPMEFCWLLSHELGHVQQCEQHSLTDAGKYLQRFASNLGIAQNDIPTEWDAEVCAWQTCQSMFGDKFQEFVAWGRSSHPRPSSKSSLSQLDSELTRMKPDAIIESNFCLFRELEPKLPKEGLACYMSLIIQHWPPSWSDDDRCEEFERIRRKSVEEDATAHEA